MSIPATVRSLLGYTWVILAIFISVMGFVNMQTFENWIIDESGLKVSENWTGGEIDSVIEHRNYQTIVHQPVFAGLLSERNKGFIQIEWIPSGCLPNYINETFDYDRDHQIDFSIFLDTVNNTVSLTPYTNRVISVKDQEVYVFEGSRAIRVNIRKK